MLDLKEVSTGHQDLQTNKYLYSVNTCPSPSIMDMLLSAGDSLTFQEIFDLDIKSDIETVLGSHSDYTSFNLADLPPLDIEDTSNDLNVWFTNSSNHSNSNFNIDFIGSEAGMMMVNPNAVMPVTLASSSSSSSSSSPHRDNSRVTQQSKLFKSDTPVVKFKTGSGSSLIRNNSSNKSTQQNNNNNNNLLNIKSTIQKQVTNNGALKVVTSTITANVPAAHPQLYNGRKAHQNQRHFNSTVDKLYPKPAYSYSCLIAMALKNSRNGSLPVSEIYNFMCEHFPYFKTAPNGWKNSVRHNLSLNKCFEKIEKPAVSGGQRKGCLWAMNPDKINKMDEEVQKWSRKDPSAIKKAMINPEYLDVLERGELKFACRSDIDDVEENYGGDSCADTEEEEEEGDDEETSDVEVEDQTELEEMDFVNVADTLYENDAVGKHNMIKIEMELIDDDLLEYETVTPSKKRSRSIVQLTEPFVNTRLYKVQTPSRRKTAYLIKNE